MYIGGVLIKRFDGFRRLCRRAATEFNHPLAITDEDLQLANRTLAALGGPPAGSEVRGRFTSDGLPLLLLFFLTQEMPCRIGLLGQTEAAMGRLKSLIHLFGHAVYPLISTQPPLAFAEVVRELGPSGALLKPCVVYEDRDGEPTEILRSGSAGQLRIGSEGGPYTLAVLQGEATGPARLQSANDLLHPAVLILP